MVRWILVASLVVMIASGHAAGSDAAAASIGFLERRKLMRRKRQSGRAKRLVTALGERVGSLLSAAKLIRGNGPFRDLSAVWPGHVRGGERTNRGEEVFGSQWCVTAVIATLQDRVYVLLWGRAGGAR